MAISNNNVQNVKFLRNGSLFLTRDAARTALEGFTGLTYEKDGTAILARYGSDNAVKTLVGWVYADNNGHKSVTIFDIDDAGTDAKAYVDSLVGSGITSANTATAQLEALSGNNESTSAQTSVEGAKRYADEKVRAAIDGLDVAAITAPAGAFIKGVSQADGKISATTAYMPTVESISETGKAITAVSQSNGTVAASAGNINSQYVDVEYSAITATNVKDALAEIADEIDAMDKSASAEDGQVVTTVSEVDGVVSETKANVKDLQLGGYSKSSSTGAIASADTINEALSKLENKAAAITIDNDDHSINVTTASSGTNIAVNIKSGEKVIKLGNDGIYTDIKIASATPSSTTVKEEYNLLDSDGNALGTSIKIYKDSHIVSITYITDSTSEHYQNLEYKYIDASGTEQTEYVDISSLVLEVEFASGITVTDHVAHGVVDSTSEKDESDVAFLTVGADGFKISGIKDAIDTKINKLDANLSGNSTHVTVGVAEADGKITAVTVSESNVANADDLITLSGKSVTAVAMSGGSADIVANETDGTKKITINADGASIKMTGYAKGSASGAVESTDSVNAAIGKLENQIAGKIDALDATVSGETVDGKVNVKVTEANGVITAVDVVGTDIASDSALTAEIAARKAVDGVNGDAYTADTNAHYISAATTLYGADQALDSALASLDADVIKSVKVNGVALAETSNAVNVQISSAAASGAASSPIVVNTNNESGAVTLQIQYLDCGVYDAQ